MKPVEQTRTEYRYGNCWQACLASIFEVALEEVPDWNPNGENPAPSVYHKMYADWLAERGVCMVELDATLQHEVQSAFWDTFYIIGARSPRIKGLHAVVGHKGKIVWDPHPQREMGVGEIVDYTFFCPINLP